MQTQIDQLVLVKEHPSGISVQVNTDVSRLLALQVYADQLEKIISRTMQRALYADVRITGKFCAIVARTDWSSADALAMLLRQRIGKVASTPLRRNHVERILNITPKECARWSIIEAWRREDESPVGSIAADN